MSVMFLAKLANPIIGTARILVDCISIKGDCIFLSLTLVMLLLTITSTSENKIFPTLFNDAKRLTINSNDEKKVVFKSHLKF